MRERASMRLCLRMATACVLAGCAGAARQDASESRTRAATAATSAERPDEMRLLDLGAAVNPTNVAARGTCISIDAERRSRVVYLMLPAESSYVRLAVVSPREPIEMVDLVRGIPDGRIWSATYDGARRSATARLFASANDKSPATDEWFAGDPRLQRFLDVARTAIQSPCALQ